MVLDHDDVYAIFQKKSHGIHMKWGLSNDDVTGEFLKDKLFI